MSDDIVKRLRDACPATQDFAHTTQGDLMDEAADRIEQLTAERDARIDPALVQDLIKAAEPVLAEAYLGEYIRANDADAERDQLREILLRLLAHEPDHPDTTWQAARAAAERTADAPAE